MLSDNSIQKRERERERERERDEKIACQRNMTQKKSEREKRWHAKEA